VEFSNLGRLPDAFLTTGSSSFTDFLHRHAPELLPGNRLAATGVTGNLADLAPHGTTIVSLRVADGVVMAGDRRATAGNMIAQREMEKVFQSDAMSVVGISGSSSIAIELVRLFQLELEHYEKIEGTVLSLEGKANRLSHLIRGNLGLAMQGLVVVPLFAGFDLTRGTGRIFSYDPTGGPYEERPYYAIGSGSVFARGSIKKLYSEDMSLDEAAEVAVQSLYDAAEDDAATGGPDLHRKIYPTVSIVDSDGYRQLSDDDVAAVVERVVTGRTVRPDGPRAPLSS
jgi:proteasome beta subunit